MLDIHESAEDITEVFFTHEDLVKPVQEENGWKLVSLMPFNSDEVLTVVLKNSIVY